LAEFAGVLPQVNEPAMMSTGMMTKNRPMNMAEQA
jgi:hypothetical protein